MTNALAKDMVEAWRQGQVCLHPTDTLPGLSFNPYHAEGERRFMAMKRRPPEKKPISLVGSWEALDRCWQPLPKGWRAVLQELWPASLSVIWVAGPDCPASLVSADGTLGLRMPQWKPEFAFMRLVLEELAMPFPSSSVNVSSEPAARDWDEALVFAAAAGADLFVPALNREQRVILEKQRSEAQPSTLIRIDEDGSFSVIRAGAVPSSIIQSAWEHHGQRP